MTYDTIDAIVGREAQILGYPIRLLNAHYTHTTNHVIAFVIYEHDQPGLGVGIRYAVYIDGRQDQGGIVGFRESAA